MGKMPCFLTKSWDIYTHFSFSPKLKWPRFWSQMIPNFYIISYVYVSYEKREYKNNMEIFNQTRHFFICQSSFISFKSLTSLKTALKNYTWKVCVLPQQNAFGRPFSLKKHEEMFCDFAQTSGFFGESRHTKCISLGEMHFWQFWRKTLNWTKWCSFYIEINFFLAHYGLDFGPKNMNVHFAQGNTLCMSTFTEETRIFRKVAKHFFVFLQWKWPSKCVLLRQNANFSCVNY